MNRRKQSHLGHPPRANLPRPAPPSIRPECALFLDFDGTLVDLQDDPARVQVDRDLCSVLAGARRLLGGAVALVSGRAIAQLDTLFAPERPPAAGIHGLERRSAHGMLQKAGNTQTMRRAAWKLRDRFASDRRIRVEDKGAALAIHFRGHAEIEGVIRAAAVAMLKSLGDGYRLMAGADVFELLPTGASKGSAVHAFMAEPPFVGRMPVFVGDDLTDIDGFRAAVELGGYAVAVGNRVDAGYRLSGPSAVRDWLLAGSL